MKIILVIALLLLPGCATFQKSVFEGGMSVTATVTNPVTYEQLAAVQASYGVAAAAVANYMELRQCKRSEVESATNWCSRYSVKVKLQLANRRAYFAVMLLSNFVRTKKTISAVSALEDAKAALRDFQNIAVSSGIKVQ